MTETSRPAAHATAIAGTHVGHAQMALEDYRRIGIDGQGMLMNPSMQIGNLRIALQEIARAISIIETTTWPTQEE
jgi:hypothetical protein